MGTHEKSFNSPVSIEWQPGGISVYDMLLQGDTQAIPSTLKNVLFVTPRVWQATGPNSALVLAQPNGSGGAQNGMALCLPIVGTGWSATTMNPAIGLGGYFIYTKSAIADFFLQYGNNKVHMIISSFNGANGIAAPIVQLGEAGTSGQWAISMYDNGGSLWRRGYTGPMYDEAHNLLCNIVGGIIYSVQHTS